MQPAAGLLRCRHVEVVFHLILLLKLNSGVLRSLVTGKAYLEQLTEMTRLVFKLSEVESILSKAQAAEPAVKQDPKSALVHFIKVLHISLFTLCHTTV